MGRQQTLFLRQGYTSTLSKASPKGYVPLAQHLARKEKRPLRAASGRQAQTHQDTHPPTALVLHHLHPLWELWGQGYPEKERCVKASAPATTFRTC